MNYIKKIIIISVVTLALLSCYIQDEENPTATNLSLNMQIPDSVLAKASSSVYYFEITMYQDDGKGESIETYTKEVVVGSSEIAYNGMSGGTFPIILTDVPPGDYEELLIQYYEPGNYTSIGRHSDAPFTIDKGVNNTISITMGGY